MSHIYTTLPELHLDFGVTGRINQSMRRLFPNWKDIILDPFTPALNPEFNHPPTETDFNFRTPPEDDLEFPSTRRPS